MEIDEKLTKICLRVQISQFKPETPSSLTLIQPQFSVAHKFSWVKKFLVAHDSAYWTMSVSGSNRIIVKLAAMVAQAAQKLALIRELC